MTDLAAVPLRYLAREIDDRSGSGLPLLSVSIHLGVRRRDELTKDEPRADTLANYKRCSRGDLVVNRMRAFQGALGVAPIDGVVSPDYAILRPSSLVEARFLAYVLRSRWGIAEMASRLRGIGGIASGVVRTPRVNVADLFDIRIPAFDIARQRATADFLDSESERIARLDATLLQFRQVCAEELSSRLGDALQDVRAEYRPLAWAVDPARPIMYGIVLPGEPVSDGVLLVKGGNVERDELLPRHLVRVSPAIEAKYARARLRGGDLLVTIRGSWGAVAQLPPESDGANITQDTARVSPASHVDARFLLHVLRAPSSRSWLGSRVRGTGVKGINIFDLRRLMVPMPPLDHQRKLAATFDAWAERDQRLAAVVHQTRVRLADYRDALITEAVTAQLDVTAISDAHMDERAREAGEGAIARTPAQVV